MRRLLLSITLILFCFSIGTAADGLTVKYLSMEHVYLNGGEADGLTVGTRLNVLGPQGIKAELEVVFVAAHSASCKVIGKMELVQVGDRVQLQGQSAQDTVITVDSVPPPMIDAVTESPKPAVTKPTRRVAPVTGNLSLLFYHYNDDTESNLDFTQATTRLSLKARRLFGKEITFAIRGRGRFDKRERDFVSGVDREDWVNRVWELSLSYEEPSSPINAAVGRILPRRIGAVGYLDGALLEAKPSGSLRLGVFGGNNPDWLSDDRRVTLTKAGGYLGLVSPTSTKMVFEQIVGFVGEYHAGEVNREYLVLQGRISDGGQWGLGHSSEFDINRDWRKARAGSSFDLSSLYLNGWVRPSDRLRLSLSYDNRTNYWTFDTRSMVDSLFDDHLRQGARGQIDITILPQLFTSGSVGYRKRTGEPDPTWSYSAQLRKVNALIQGLSLQLQYAGFDGPTNRGFNYSARANRMFGNHYYMGIAYGSYAYRTDGLPDYRTNNWLELSGQADIGRHYWLGLQLQTDSGDDLKGYRLQSELGYRF